MKKIITTFLIMAIVVFPSFGQDVTTSEQSDFFKNMTNTDKAAILMVYFGTTHDDTRAKTINALSDRVKKEYPDIEVRNAYTSRIVLKRLKDRGVNILNPIEALKKMHNEGYTHILIQTSTVIDGVEMESLNKNVDELNILFKEIRIGDPLLYSPDDYKAVVEALTSDYKKDTAYVWVGHGTYSSTTAQYTMVDYILKAQGHNNCFVGTIEGYPAYDDMLSQLKKSQLRNVVLVPFMFVAGEHAKNDISEDWKEDLEKEGFNVSVDMRGLGENPKIQEIYLDHLKFITKHRKVGIMEKKSIYEVTGEKY